MKRSKLPSWIEIRDSTIPNAGLGAFTRVDIKKGRLLGVYRGRMMEPSEYEALKDPSYVWVIKSGDLPIQYIDGRQLKSSNWTRYVNCPRTRAEENVRAIQYGLRILYYSKRNIKAGEELLVWYGALYGAKLTGRTTLD